MDISRTTSERRWASAGWGLSTLALVTAMFGCSGATGADSQDDDRAIRGFVTVERSVALDQESRSATSVVRFVDAPTGDTTQDLLSVAGLMEADPPVGECQSPSIADRTSFVGLEHVELLDAGEVAVTAGGQLHRLAPRVFPDVSGVASGVMYTTRDRTQEQLPAGVEYTVTTSETPHVPGLSITATAPQDLRGVSVGGTPVSDLQALTLSRPLDITWDVGTTGDLVYVELATENDAFVCAFRDEDGAASIASETLATLGQSDSVYFAVHRVRVVDYFGKKELRLQGARVRFDFELTQMLDAQ